MLKFKKATFGDEITLHTYIKKLAKYEKLEDEVSDNIELITKNIFEDKKANAIILENENGENIGFTLYFYNFSTFNLKPGIYIEDLYIDEKHRGKGYGSEVFNYYKEKAQKENCGRVEWICLDWNKPAVEFYENKIGATSLNGWTIRRLIEDNF